MKRLLGIIFVITALSGCRQTSAVCSSIGLCDETVVPIVVDVFLDTTTSSPGRDAANVRDTLVVACRVAAARIGSVRVHVLGADVSTTRLVWEQDLEPAADMSTQGQAAHTEGIANRCIRAAEPLIPEWVRNTPDASPVFAGLTKTAMTSAGQGDRYLLVLSDLRDESGGTRAFECGILPSETTAFLASLRREGIFPAESLRGFSRIYFLYSTVSPVDGKRCVQDLARFDRLKAIWTSVIIAAGGQPFFLTSGIRQEHLTIKVQSAFLIPGVVGVLFLPWAVVRSLRIKYTAWRDKHKGHFGPWEAIVLVIRRCPFFNPSQNPTHRKWADLLASAGQHLVMAREEVRYYNDLLAGFLPMGVLVAGLFLFLLLDWISNVVLIKDTMPMDPPERASLALLAAAGVVLVTWWLRHQTKKGHGKLLYLAGGLYVLIAFGMTTARLKMIAATRALTIGDVGITCIALLTVLGTPWLCELAIAQIETILSDWRKLRRAQRDLHQAQLDDRWARTRIDALQQRREAWFGEAERYAAQYLTVHRNAKGPITTPHITVTDVMEELDRYDGQRKGTPSMLDEITQAAEERRLG